MWNRAQNEIGTTHYRLIQLGCKVFEASQNDGQWWVWPPPV